MYTKRFLVLGVILLLSMTLYMTLGARGSWSFILPFRGIKLAALLLVAIAISTSTVLFQTITQNRILTPGIMGFDALYILILTCSVFVLGGQDYLDLPLPLIFAVNVIGLTLAALLLFGTLLGRSQNDLMRMILTGIIFGTLFRSITAFLVRMIDPNEYSVIQVNAFARFNQIETDLLWPTAVLLLGAVLVAWQMRHRLDVLALGRTAAINLGENPRRGRFQTLVVVAILVAASTALVGPVVFLGLLVVSLAHLVTPSAHHAVILPSAALISAIVLVSGQTILERVLALSTPLSVVVDFAGGLLFLALLLKGLRR